MSDFTVIMNVRHRFGDQRKDKNQEDIDSAAPFVGQSGEFQFSCPNVNPSQVAVLQFEHRGSNQFLNFPNPQPDGGLVGITPEHPVHINGRKLSGGVSGAPFSDNGMPIWNTRVLLIPVGVLQEDNILRIETTNNGATTGADVNFDNFTIDNVVVFFKTRSSPAGGVVKPT